MEKLTPEQKKTRRDIWKRQISGREASKFARYNWQVDTQKEKKGIVYGEPMIHPPLAAPKVLTIRLRKPKPESKAPWE